MAVVDVCAKNSILRRFFFMLIFFPRFWLSVAALAVLKDKQWLELAESWRNLQQTRSDEPEMICENHDDGRTRAQVKMA